MSEWLSHVVWETLPAERQRGVVFALGQMAMRQIRTASTGQESAVREKADDRRGSYPAAGRELVREDLPAAS